MDPAQFRKLFGKDASTGFVLFMFVLYLVIDKGPDWIRVLRSEKTPPQQVKGDSTTQESNRQAPTTLSENEECYSYLPLEGLNIKLQLDQIRKKSESVYYPTGKAGNWEGTLWMTQELNPTFKSIFIEYEVSPANDEGKPPAVTLSLARTKDDKSRQFVAKIWVPEYSEVDNEKIPQLFGFAKNIDYSQNDLKRETSEPLPDAAKTNQVDSILVEPTGINGNEMMINFTYSYTSNITGVALPFTISKKINFPFSDLQNSNEKLDLGIGTYVGNHIRLISLKICR